jgi:hypothetical protein
MKVFRELNSQLAWERDANGVLKECVLEEGVEKGEVVSAAARLRPLEVKALRQLRHQSPASVKGLRKPWKKIRREPEAPNGRDEQVLALQEKGFTYRMAREIVDVIVRVCVEGLQRDKTLGTPLGWFKAVPAGGGPRVPAGEYPPSMIVLPCIAEALENGTSRKPLVSLSLCRFQQFGVGDHLKT